jgi:hypothetical protein
MEMDSELFDIETLKRLGSRIGEVGSALELGVGLYEVLGEGKSPLEVAAMTAGGMAGAWGLGQVGALGVTSSDVVYSVLRLVGVS